MNEKIPMEVPEVVKLMLRFQYIADSFNRFSNAGRMLMEQTKKEDNNLKGIILLEYKEDKSE